jgi:hypothetical protein
MSKNNNEKGNRMSEIQRWEVGFSQMNEHDQGEFITWNDHCAALKAARNELPNVGSRSPEPKFKIGNQVTHMDSKKVRKIKNYYFSLEDNEWKYDIGFYYVESELTLYVPPTPAELIPTLKEHEWVQGTYVTGTKFEGYVYRVPLDPYYPGTIWAGRTVLKFNGRVNDGIATIERCEAPEVVK